MADNNSIGPKIAITGEAEFKNSMKAIGDEFKALDSEMKLAASQFERNDKSTAALTAKNQVLGKELDTAKGKVAILTTQYGKQKDELSELEKKLAETKAAFSADSAEVAKAQKEYDAQSGRVRTLKTDLNKTEASINSLDRELKNNTKNIAIQSSKWTDLGNKMNDASDKMKTVGGKITGVGSDLSMGLTVPILAAGVASAKLASDLEENMNKVDVSFKGNADKVKIWSDTTLKSFGISQGSALEMVSLFGDMASGMDINTESAADMSSKLVGLAGDLASFKNIGIDQASDALKGIFTGEGESLKSLGVIMTDSTLSAFALEKGSKTLYGEMTQGEKVMLRYEYVLDKTKNSAGDFARTSEGTANQTRIFAESMKELGANMGQYILPVVTPMISKLSDLAQAFGDLDEGTKKIILGSLAVAAAVGPALVITGTLISSVGTIAGLFGGASLAAGGAAAATGTLGAAFGAAMIPLAPYLLAIGGVLATGLLIKDAFSQEVVPEIDLLADKMTGTSNTMAEANGRMGTSIDEVAVKISEGTEKAVGSYIDLDDKATKSLTDLFVNSTVITTELKDSVVAQYAEMARLVKEGLDKRYAEELLTMQNFFIDSAALSMTEEQKALELLKTDNEKKKEEEEKNLGAIASIMQNAANGKREITLREQAEIEAIQAEMKTNAIKVLSESEVESALILERIKEYGTRVTAEQASEIIKSAIKQKEESIKSANEQYDGTVASIIRMRDESHSITAEQAELLIADAQRQKEGVVQRAEDTKTDAIAKVFAMNKSIGDSVDVKTGEILKNWGKLKLWWTNWNPESKTFRYTISGSTNGGGAGGGSGGSWGDGFASGTTNASPGIHWVGENGPELMNFRGGETVLNARDSVKATNGVTQSPPINITLTLDGKVLARQLYDPMQGENRMRGRALTTGA